MKTTKLLVVILFSIAVLACGGGGGGGGSPTNTNTAPVANAGTVQNVTTGSLVTLNGSASSDANGDPLTYSWTLTSKPTGSTATLTNATSVSPTFTAGLAGTYIASLTVNDGQVNSTSASVTITATTSNAAPVANAGTAQNVTTGVLVTLNGSASSDANGNPLTYIWTLTSKPTGSTATLSNATSVSPTFTADLAGSYIASLTVNDGQVNSTSTSVTITAAAGNSAPTANAGITQNVTTGSLVTLNGSASSDANGDPLTYNWTLTSKPSGSTATLSGATSVSPTFTADLAGIYVASLVVNDGQVNSTVATVTVTASVATSATYNVTVTRIGQNFYSIAGFSTILQTKFCYEYASSESAVLVMSAFTGVSDGTITFASGASCTVAGAYYPLTLSAGNYSATLSFEDYAFYSDSLQQVLIRSSDISCFKITYYNSSILTLTSGGFAYLSGVKIGTITFSDNSTCDLIGIYGLSKLN